MSIIPGTNSGFPDVPPPAPDGAVLYNAPQSLSAGEAKQARDNIGAMTTLQYANLAAFPVTGAGQTIYRALDTGVKYLWTGSVYQVFTEVGSIPLEMFGATTALADTTTQIQSAIDYAAANGKILVSGPGTYNH